MNKKNTATAGGSTNDQLQHLATDLGEVYNLLHGLCSKLAGGGIVQARDIEPSVARAVPKLRRAVADAERGQVMISEGQPDDGLSLRRSHRA